MQQQQQYCSQVVGDHSQETKKRRGKKHGVGLKIQSYGGSGSCVFKFHKDNTQKTFRVLETADPSKLHSSFVSTKKQGECSKNVKSNTPESLGNYSPSSPTSPQQDLELNLKKRCRHEEQHLIVQEGIDGKISRVNHKETMAPEAKRMRTKISIFELLN